jgi:3-oxoacyl-[acyl-carrier protein] reductase
MFERIAERFGTLHILVNNAALVQNQPAEVERRDRFYEYLTTPMPRQSPGFTKNLTDEEWHRFWGVNVHGVFYCTRAALQFMEEQKYGRIINIGSTAGQRNSSICPTTCSTASCPTTCSTASSA